LKVVAAPGYEEEYESTQGRHEQRSQDINGESDERHACEAQRVFGNAAPEKRRGYPHDARPEPNRAARRRLFHEVSHRAYGAIATRDQTKNPFCEMSAMHS
jgi:hypothetical protein